MLTIEAYKEFYELNEIIFTAVQDVQDLTINDKG